MILLQFGLSVERTLLNVYGRGLNGNWLALDLDWFGVKLGLSWIDFGLVSNRTLASILYLITTCPLHREVTTSVVTTPLRSQPQL